MLLVSVLAAMLLSPEKYDPLADDGDEQSKPVKASTPSSPPPKPKPKAEQAGAEAGARAKPEPKPAPAAKKVRVAVLSGVPQPGAAAKEAKRLKGKGFPIRRRGQRARSAPSGQPCLYARGQQAAARDLAEAAGIASVKALDAQTAEPARGAKLVVVVGAAR